MGNEEEGKLIRCPYFSIVSVDTIITLIFVIIVIIAIMIINLLNQKRQLLGTGWHKLLQAGKRLARTNRIF